MNDKNCNQTKCIARIKCLRYKEFLKHGIENTETFAGNKSKACINYIALNKV